MTRRRRWPTLKRDTAIWFLGLGIAIHETIIEPEAQLEVLIFAAGLLGLPGILAANEFAKRLVIAANSMATEPPTSGQNEGAS